jgi:hypothetical protein
MAKLTLEQVVNIVNREEEIANKEYYIAKTQKNSALPRKCKYTARKKWEAKLAVAVSLSNILGDQYSDLIKDDLK